MPTRYHVGTLTPASADAAGVIGTLASLFAVTADVDVSVADGGTVVARTWTEDTTSGSRCIYSDAFGPRNCRFLIAIHDSGTPSPSPTMVTGTDTYAAAYVLIALADDAAGSYIGWNQASPFYKTGSSGAGCNFAGFVRLCPVSSATSGEIRAIVSTKDLWLQMRTTTVHSAHLGARLVGVSSPSGLAESDGYRYGVAVSGAGADQVLNWRSSSSSSPGFYGRHSTNNGSPHSYCYAVGGTSVETDEFETIRVRNCTADTGKLVTGGSPTHARVGISFGRASSPYKTIGSWAGVSEGSLARTGTVLQSASATVGAWAWSSSPTTDEDSVAVLRSF